MVGGERVVEQIKAVIKIHQKEIEQIRISESTRTLGVHITLSLQWKSQFETL